MHGLITAPDAEMVNGANGNGAASTAAPPPAEQFVQAVQGNVPKNGQSPSGGTGYSTNHGNGENKDYPIHVGHGHRPNRWRSARHNQEVQSPPPRQKSKGKGKGKSKGKGKGKDKARSYADGKGSHWNQGNQWWAGAQSHAQKAAHWKNQGSGYGDRSGGKK